MVQIATIELSSAICRWMNVHETTGNYTGFIVEIKIANRDAKLYVAK